MILAIYRIVYIRKYVFLQKLCSIFELRTRETHIRYRRSSLTAVQGLLLLTYREKAENIDKRRYDFRQVGSFQNIYLKIFTLLA